MTGIVMRADMTASRMTRPAFVGLIFGGSFLLFLTQPMIARMVLPRLGGASAVWNSAMLVYQALLLGGYWYAHRISTLPIRRQGIVHLTLLLLAACWLPIGLREVDPPAWLSPALWVPWLLISSIGPLFFVISAQAPLLQRWFAALDSDLNPYALYAASNLGSVAGLVSYPFIIELMMTVGEQRRLWTFLYLLMTVAVGMTVAALVHGRAQPHDLAAGPAPDRRRWWRWVLLAAVPSGLMLSTTVHLTTDVAAMPLLWIVPLGLYLLSFSIAFSDDRRAADAISRAAPVLIVAGAALTFPSGGAFGMIAVLFGLVVLFAVAVAIHARMYETRPAAAHLTRFYLASSTGGVLGGVLCALIAPMAFNYAWEHPLLLLVASGIVGGERLLPRWATVRASPRFAIYAVTAGTLLALAAASPIGPITPILSWVATGALILLTLATIGRRLPFALLVGCVMFACGGALVLALATTGAYSRSYFGVYTILRAPAWHGMLHGTTLHGEQFVAPGQDRTPTTYYAPQSGAGRAFAAAPALFGDRARIGVVGLGAGTLACYARPGQSWRFYEIDPEVERIARDPRDFSFLARCAPAATVVIGDARLTLADETRVFDLLAIDAFSSDAVPVHLLTREAFAIYGARVDATGLLMLHITNHWVDLSGVIGAMSARTGWTAAILPYHPDAAARARGAMPSIWIAMSRSPERIRQLIAVTGGAWHPLPDDGRPLWSDDFASVLPRLRQGGAWH